MALYNSYGEHLSWCRYDPRADGYGVRLIVLDGMRTGDDPERDNWLRKVDAKLLGFPSGKEKPKRQRSLEDLIG